MDPQSPNDDDTFAMNSIFVIDGPAGLTSHDVVNQVRRLFDLAPVGHLGTLDPLATGFFPLVTSEISLASRSSTRVGEVLRARPSLSVLDRHLRFRSRPQALTCGQSTFWLDDAKTLAHHFYTRSEQMPPPFSPGDRRRAAYRLARKNRDVPLKDSSSKG